MVTRNRRGRGRGRVVGVVCTRWEDGLDVDAALPVVAEGFPDAVAVLARLGAGGAGFVVYRRGEYGVVFLDRPRAIEEGVGDFVGDYFAEVSRYHGAPFQGLLARLGAGQF